MTRNEALNRYKAAMAVFQQWQTQGAITFSDLTDIDAVIAAKYGLSTRSIFLATACYVPQKE